MPEEIIKERKRLCAAIVVQQPVDRNPAWSLKTGNTGVDKMELPSDYHKIVDLCRFFYEHDGLAHTTINKQVEIGINGFAINPGTCSDNEYLIYESLNPLIENFLQDAAMEFLISGLVIPEVTWGNIRAADINPRLRKRCTLPIDLWYRDPQSVELRKTPLPNQIVAFVEISDEDIYFIQNEGKWSDGTQDKETYKILVDQYPDFVKAVKKGDTKFRLEDPIIIRRKPKSGKVYPTAYLLSALELFMQKRNLRKMDYALAGRVISAIQKITMGNDEFPLTEDDDDVIEELKSQMRWRGLADNIERVFQIYSNHTLEIEWITPDIEALLSDTKYKSINDDILVALGLPRIVVAGETLRSGSSNSELAMLPPINSIESMRTKLLEYPRELYRQIQKKNNFSGVPEPYYPPIRLQPLRELMEVGRTYYENGVISKTGWAEMGHFDYETEAERMVMDREIQKDLGLPERPEVPFSPTPGQTNKGEVSEDK